MNYLITLVICSCWLLSGATNKTKESNTASDGLSRGLNDVSVDFHDRTSQINSTSEMVSSGDHSTSKWIWKPIGHKINDIDSAAIVGLFENDSGSGEDDGVYEEPVNVTQTSREEIWTFNETEERVYTTQSPKTMDRKRNKTEEKAHLIYERHLKKSNWCFKDNEKANSNFKKVEARVEACCRRRRECRGRRHIKRGIYACSCDIYFHICLKKADTKMAKSIENMYFNRNIVCYKKQRKVCTNEPCEDTTYLWKIISRQPK